MTDTEPRRAYGGKPASQRQAERRERFLAAGLELFGTGGYAAASVDRICELAGLSSRQFYAQFDNRDSVLVTLYDQINDQAQQAVAAVFADEFADWTDVRRLLRRALAAYIETVAGDPRRAQVAFTTIVGVNTRVEQHRRGRRKGWVSNLSLIADELVRRGAVPHRDFTLILTAFVGAVNGLVHDWSVAEPRTIPIDDVAETLAHILYSALTTPSEQ